MSVYYRAFLELKGEKTEEIEDRVVDYSPVDKFVADNLNELCEKIEKNYSDEKELSDVLNAKFTQIFKDDTAWGHKQSYEEATDVTPKIINLLEARRNAKQKSKRKKTKKT